MAAGTTKESIVLPKDRHSFSFNQTFAHSIIQLICFVSIYCDCVILKQQGNGDAIFCHTSD